jgi:hypothetical protein
MNSSPEVGLVKLTVAISGSVLVTVLVAVKAHQSVNKGSPTDTSYRRTNPISGEPRKFHLRDNLADRFGPYDKASSLV